jgi:neutral ceramidase
MKATIRPFVLALLLAFPPDILGASPENSFRAGTARRDITPKEPVPMWGYGARRDRLSEGTLDSLRADVLVLQAGAAKLAIVGLDLGRSPSEASLHRIREEIKARAGIEHSFIGGSHTHHGPVLELSDEQGKGRGRFDAALRYYKELEETLIEAVVEANSKLAPARLAAGSVPLEGFNRNRHTKLEPKPVDRDLAVLRVDDASGQPVAVLVNFAAHPTMIPAATLKFSADYIGPLKQVIEEELGGTAIFMQGASGDLSVQQGPHQGYEAYGRALGREAVQLARKLEPIEPRKPRLAMRDERFTFAPRTDFSNPIVRAAFSLAFFPELVGNYIDEYADGIRPRLTVAVLNEEIAFVGVSGEVFCNHAIRLKERARIKQLFFFGCCNGYHQYFPTIEAAAEGGYGADRMVSPAAIGAGEQLMNAALLWIYQLSDRMK